RPDLTEGAVEWRVVGGAYADVMGLRLVAGRWFADAGTAGERQGAVVNSSFAARDLPNGHPIGQRVQIGRLRGQPRPGTHPVSSEIVGVVADMRELGPTRVARRTVFTPQTGTTGLPVFLVRAPRLSADVLRAAVHEADAALPEPVITTFESKLASRL